MSKVFRASVILFLLTALWSHHTALSWKISSRDRLPFPCKCNYLPSKKLICQRGYIPKTLAETKEQVKCLCKTHYQGELQMHRPHVQKLCKIWYYQIPIPLPLA